MTINPEFLCLVSVVFMAQSMPGWMSIVFGWVFLVWALLMNWSQS